MTEDLHKQLEEMVARMPAFSASVQRVLKLTSDISCSAKELVQVIEHDPVMTLKILKLLNSAYFSLPRKITSIHQSVVYLGFNTIKNMALSIATLGILPQKNKAGFDTQGYLKHSLSTAAIARLLHQKFNHKDFDASDCFVAGLLHDIGKVVYAQFNPHGFARIIERSRSDGIAVFRAERHLIGADHSLIGAMLGEKWNFPQSLVGCIGEHHEIEKPGNEIRDSVIAANQISKALGCGEPVTGKDADLPASVADRFGMDLRDLIKYLGDISVHLDHATAQAGI
ncbi:MAG: HDOD domain-containing protein [Methylococcaceae bacterium]|nr:HDOD domain-containing protein [Methylococcaceae bacterium]MCI0666986.1 HDOD domain-containing protein [Methylococcaceae bacterium]MCI0732563.1 HDOD domain-containing protein [Methylococcaceae bacterium]